MRLHIFTKDLGASIETEFIGEFQDMYSMILALKAKAPKFPNSAGITFESQDGNYSGADCRDDWISKLWLFGRKTCTKYILFDIKGRFSVYDEKGIPVVYVSKSSRV